MSIPAGYQFGDCRGILRHSWHEVSGDWTPALGGVPMTLICERCGMERRDTLQRGTADVLGRRYLQPQGYAITGDEDKPKIADFRVEWLLNHMKKNRSQK